MLQDNVGKNVSKYNIDPVKVAAAGLSLNPYAHYEIDKKLKSNLKRSTRGFSNKLNDDTHSKRRCFLIVY